MDRVPFSGRPVAQESLLITVCERRTAAGLSQAELARRVGVSRQALIAIEAGRQVPSTMLALQLARALQCSVDDLFRLARGEVVQARLAAPLEGARRVAVGFVGEGFVAHPLCGEADAADGVVVNEAGEGDMVTVELFSDLASIEANVLVAGCAPLLGMLADRLGRRFREMRATWIHANSTRALELLERGLVHLAGTHLADAANPQANFEAAQRAVNRRATLINLARWKQGLVLAPGNPLELRVGCELLRPELRYVVREPGSGAQRVLERMLHEAGDAAVVVRPGLPLARDHAEVAKLVRQGLVDVGVAIESSALQEHLDFIPVSEERFDLVVPQPLLHLPPVTRFLELIEGPAFRAEAAELRGYDLSLAGDASTIDGPTPGA